MGNSFVQCVIKIKICKKNFTIKALDNIKKNYKGKDPVLHLTPFYIL